MKTAKIVPCDLFAAGWRCAAFGLASVLLSFATTAQAAPITQTVTIGDKEWAQVNLFTTYVDIYSTIDPNFSMLTWEQVNAQCPAGVCGPSAQLNSWDLAGWTWASSNEVATEILAPYSLWPEYGAYYGGTEWMIAQDQLSPLLAATGFQPSFDTCPGCQFEFSLGYKHSIGLGGWTRDAGDFSYSYAGALYTNYVEQVGNAVVNETHFVTGTVSGNFMSPLWPASGAWFYREVQPAVVPVPAAAWLLGSGLLGLFGVARLKKALDIQSRGQ